MRFHGLWSGAVVSLVLAVTACGGGAPSSPDTPTTTTSATSSTSPTTPPTTITATTTVTEAPARPEAPDSTTDPAPETPEEEVDSLQPEGEQASDDESALADSSETDPEPEGIDFDAAWARTCADRVVESMEVVDERLVDGNTVSSALDLLSASFDCFEDAGVPAGSDPADYTALIRTLSDFSWDAADLYWDDPMTATAKYKVVKENTESLFATINATTGSSYRVP